jgi:hypothetical protein
LAKYSGVDYKKEMLGIFIVLPALLVFFGACTPPVVMLVNPKNGDVRRCSAEDGSDANAFVSETRIKACVHQWKSVGYVEVDRLSPEERARIAPQR